MLKSFGDFNSSEIVQKNEHSFEIIPCPYEETTSYAQGTKLGPEAILEASQELEFYDDELGLDPSVKGIKTLEPVEIPLQDSKSKDPFGDLRKACLDSYERGKFPIVLGGEHSLSLGSVMAAYEYAKSISKKKPELVKEANLTVLHFDAHADLRKEYQGNPYSHAAAIYQIYKHCPGLKIVSVGIRNISEEEVEWLNNGDAEHANPSKDIKIFCARNEKKNLSGFPAEPKFKSDQGAWEAIDVLAALEKFGNQNLYITFDVDGFDSTLMPATGTPEPGGLDWCTPTNIIREAAKKFNLIGADIVELAPISGFHASDFLVAKLIYKIMAYSSHR